VFTRDQEFRSYRGGVKRGLISCLSAPLWIGRFVGVGRKGSGSSVGKRGRKVRVTAGNFSALQLGEVGDSGVGGYFDESDDPLGYLSPDERQAYINELKISEVGEVEKQMKDNEKRRIEKERIEVAEKEERERREKSARKTFKGPE